MRAGQLDRQISLEMKSVTVDPNYGTELVSWVPFIAGRIWAEVQDVLPSRSEAVKQGLTVARNQTRIRMRWIAGIDSSMRITVYGDTTTVYQIVGGPAEIQGRKQMLEMMCEKYSS
jgi:head-tail adaptor